MLVLSRKVGESFVIGDDITVTVVQVGASGVRLGIEADGNHEIVRREVLDAAKLRDGKNRESERLSGNG